MARDTGFFDTIKQQVDLVDLAAKHYNVDLVGDGVGRMAACCPFHAEDTPSFKISESFDGAWKRWHCFGACSEGGTVIDFVMKAEAFEDAFEAAMYLNELYDLGLDANDEAWQRFKQNRERNEAEFAKDRAEMADESSAVGKKAREYLHARGFNDETIDHFDIAVNKDKARLAIPLVDKANHLISIAHRALFDSAPCRSCKDDVTAKEVRKRLFQTRKAMEKGEEVDFDWTACPHCGAAEKEAGIKFLARQDPKYLFEGEFEKAHFLYHQLPSRRALLKERDETRGIYVVEGYADVWAGWQSGHHAIVAYNGGVMSDWQAKQITEMAVAADKPVILVPDTDTTGRANVENNYRLLREANAKVIIQVVHGVETLTYTQRGVEKQCKDLGDVLQHFGADKLHELLISNRWPVEEWLIRFHVTKLNEKTGEPFHEKGRQMQLVREILGGVNDQIALDHLVPFLAEHWRIRQEEARGWFYSNLAASDVVSAQHLIKDVWQAQAEALEFNADKDNVIPFGYEDIDRCLPGGGARKGWLCMYLGKSQPLDADVLTPSGWRQMGDLCVGDEVVNPEGGLARIRAVYPQGVRDVYRVTFTDGASTECDLLHLWQARVGDSSMPEILTLREILTRWPAETVEIPSYDGAGLGVPRQLASVGLSRSVEAQCIALDSDNQLYVTDDNIVTHNSGTGKALAVDEPVLTPGGWVPIGELAVGDEVVDPATGGVARVTGVYPQGERQLYRATFSDGTSVECDGDHLWEVQQPGQPRRVRTTLDIKDRIARGGYHNHHRIPLPAPVQFAGRLDRPVDPYVLGVLLGDGSLTGRSLRLASMDPDLVERFGARLPVGVAVELSNAPTERDRGAYYVRCADGHSRNTLWPMLEELGVRGCTSADKFVPDAYKYAPIADRLELLRGLMDTDGSIGATTNNTTGTKTAIVEFCSVSERLAADVSFLVRSLGGIAKVTPSPSGYRNGDGQHVACRTRYRVHVALPEEINPFQIDRKASLFVRSRTPRKRFISIEPTRIADAVCIKVDSPRELFITRDFIVTHNTMLSTALLGNMASLGTRSIIFSLEQKAGALWERMACQILDMDHEGVQALMEDLWEKVGEELTADNPPDIRKLLDSNCPELAAVNEVHKNLYIVDNTPTGEQDAVAMTPGKIQAIIREINMTKFEDRPADVVFIDHLGILEVPEHAPRDVKGNDLAAPGFIMQELFKVCKATNTLMCVLQQLPKEVKPGVPVDYDAGRGGSKQTDFCDLIFGIYRPEMQIDLDDAERQALAGEYKLRLGKNRHGPSATAHLFFDKTSLRIIPAANVKMPVVDGLIQGGDGASDDDTIAITIGAATVGEDGASVEPAPILIGIESDNADPMPRDREALLALLGAQPEDGFENEPVEQLASEEDLAAFTIGDE